MVGETSSATSSSLFEPSINWKGVSLVVLTPALGGFLYGYDIGAMSFVLKQLLLKGDSSSSHIPRAQEVHNRLMLEAYDHDDVFWSPTYLHDKESFGSTLNFNDDYYQSVPAEAHQEASLPWWTDLQHHRLHQGMLVGAVSAGALLGSHLVLVCLSSSVISRRMELRVAAALYILGSLLCVSSGHLVRETSLTVGWLVLVLGRLLFGVGAGFVMHGAPTYMAEMSPARIRGAVVAAKETIIVLGILCGFVLGDWMADDTEWTDWTLLYIVSCSLAIPMLALTFFIPKSKRWLLLHGDKKEAKESMQFVYHGDISNEFESLAADINTNQGILRQESRTLDDTDDVSCTHSRLWSPQVRPALLAALGLIMSQQLSGQPSLLAYATVLFHAAGWNGHAVVVTAIVMIGASSFTVLMVDRLGRRVLLTACCATMLASTLGLGLIFWNWDEDVEFDPTVKWMALLAMLAYIGGYQLGFGPITWLVVSEVFPQDVRGSAMALCVECNYLLNFTVQCLFPIVQDTFGWGATFFIFATALLASLFFVQSNVPETSGLSLEEIETQLRRSETKDDETFTSEDSPLLQKKLLSYGETA